MLSAAFVSERHLHILDRSFIFPAAPLRIGSGQVANKVDKHIKELLATRQEMPTRMKNQLDLRFTPEGIHKCATATFFHHTVQAANEVT